MLLDSLLYLVIMINKYLDQSMKILSAILLVHLIVFFLQNMHVKIQMYWEYWCINIFITRKVPQNSIRKKEQIKKNREILLLFPCLKGLKKFTPPYMSALMYILYTFYLICYCMSYVMLL